MTTKKERVIIVTATTRLEKLKKRFNTISQAKFYLERQGGDFQDLQQEAVNIDTSLEQLQRDLSQTIKTKIINKDFLPNYIFSPQDIVMVIGQDGLVANTAKYVHGIPIIGVNPDPSRYDGVLLPYQVQDCQRIIGKVMQNNYDYKEVTMAEAKLNDGQRLLAFNDFFIGPSTHRSARYKLTFQNKVEQQSSSGIIVSTGAGSTGWLSSLVNMANGICRTFAPNTHRTSISKSMKAPKIQRDVVPNQTLAWDANKLFFVVREPFLSRMSNISLCAGVIEGRQKLKIESLMPQGGVIFSDGIEDDFLRFTSGTLAEIGIAKERATLVI